MNILIYDTLPDEAAEIRRAVFVEEQGFHNEFDEIDKRAKHIVFMIIMLLWQRAAFLRQKMTEAVSLDGLR